MISRSVKLLPGFVGGAIFLFTIVLPTVGLLARAALALEPPTDGFALTARQGMLLAKTVGLAAFASGVALAVSLPGAYVVGQIGRLERRPLLTALFAAPLLFPPTVFVFGWQRILPPSMLGWLECVGVWSLWAYPIPALLIGAGWDRLGRSAYEAALLDATPSGAFRRAALPLLAPHIALSLLVVFVVFLGDYGVPHACAVAVYSSELLGWTVSSQRAIDTLWPSLPCAAVVLAGLLGAHWAWRRCTAAGLDAVDAGAGGPPVHRQLGFALGVFALAFILPVGALVARMGSLDPMRVALETYSRELCGSLAVAAAGGVLSVGMGLAIVISGRFQRIALIWALAFGALPGALVGEALIASYLPLAVVYGSPLIVVLGYVARFGWIGILAAQAGLRSTAEECVEQARIDGADELSVALHIRAPAAWPMFLLGACLVAAFSLAEIPTSSLVQVPGLGLISQILIEKFHKFEDGMLISLSLWLVLAALPAAGLIWIVARRRRL